MADSDVLTTLRERLVALIRRRCLAVEPERAQPPEDTVTAAPPQNAQPAETDAQAASPPKPLRKRRRIAWLFNRTNTPSLPKPIRKRRRIERLFNRTNTALAIAASIVAIFVAYPSFKPWFEPLFAPWFAPALPKRQDPARFTVAIAHLAHDDQEQHERLLIEELKALNIEILPLGRTIHLDATQQAEQQREEHGHAEARQYLTATGADALIWGYVHTIDGKSAPRFYWTTAQAGRRSQEAYAQEHFHLPDLFWEDVVVVLRLLLTSADSQFIDQSGQFLGDRLVPFIGKTRQLLANATPGQKGWTAEGIASTRFILANALSTFGEQTGNNTALEEAVAAYRAALLERTREQVPLNWAGTQNNLGNALATLGERELGTARLEEAVAAYRAALLERTREKVPLNWAGTQNNLGLALQRLGERERGSARLEEAVAAYQAALEEYTRERAPLQWAMTQNNLGTALWTLGEREPSSPFLPWKLQKGAARLEEAASAYRAALLERTRERVPLQWAMTQNNLGTALWTLGEREPSTRRLQEAASAYRAALLERTRERVPLQWATTQNNLGTALRTLGEHVQQESVGCQALESHVAAWEVYTSNAEYYETRARDNLQDDVALLRGKLASPEAQTCLARYEAVLKRMGVE